MNESGEYILSLFHHQRTLWWGSKLPSVADIKNLQGNIVNIYAGMLIKSV